MNFVMRTIGRYLIWTWLAHHTHYTNATFWRRATMQARPRDLKPWAWHWMPGYQRFLIKSGLFLTVTVGFWGWYWEHNATVYTILALTLLAVAVGGWQGYRSFRLRKHTREYVNPLHHTLGHQLGYYPARAEEWMTIPTDFKDEDTQGARINLPPGVPVPEEVQKAVSSIVGYKLELTHLSANWHLSGPEPHVIFRPEPQAPRSVSFQDVQELIRNTSGTAPLIGLTKRNQPVYLDLEDDSPHVLVSAGSGGGKSVLAKAVIAQALRHGDRVVICDRKRISHKWAKDLSGVEYHRDIPDIHRALIELSSEGDRRNRLTDHQDALDVGSRIWLIFEEMNATTGKLRQYWEGIREKDDVKSSPAVTALGDLVNMGRQVSMHVMAIGQRIETRTLGGGDIRESFGIRLLARYTVQTWKMLCADVMPMPRKSKTRGRWQTVVAGEALDTQVVFMSDDEAQMLSRERVDLGDKAGTALVGTVTLPEAFGDEYDKLRKAAQRDLRFPEPVVRATGGAHLYRADEVDEWLKERVA